MKGQRRLKDKNYERIYIKKGRLRTKRLKERDYEKIYRKGKKIKNIEIER